MLIASRTTPPQVLHGPKACDHHRTVASPRHLLEGGPDSARGKETGLHWHDGQDRQIFL